MPFKHKEVEKAWRLSRNEKKLAYMKRRYEAEREVILVRQREGYARNRARRLADMKAYAKEHPEVNKSAVRKYAAKKRLDPKWRAHLAEKARRNRAANPERYREINRESYRTRRENPSFVIECRLRARLNKILRISKAPKFDSTFALVGCDAQFLRGYLEAQFTPGMQWNNVHIDHIKPLASFDLTNEDEQRRAFHYTNLQPLLAFDNMAKGSR